MNQLNVNSYETVVLYTTGYIYVSPGKDTEVELEVSKKSRENLQNVSSSEGFKDLDLFSSETG